MTHDKNPLFKYQKMKQDGMHPKVVFQQAKLDGFKNYECINIVMIMFDLGLHEAREISHRYYLLNKIKRI